MQKWSINPVCPICDENEPIPAKLKLQAEWQVDQSLIDQPFKNSIRKSFPMEYVVRETELVKDGLLFGDPIDLVFAFGNSHMYKLQGKE